MVQQRKVKYLREETTVYVFDTRMESWVNIENMYRGVSIRDKVICRVDLTRYLTCMFKDKTLDEYRNAIMNIITYKMSDVATVSAVLTILAGKDEVFANQLKEILVLCNEEDSFGNCILSAISDVIFNQVIKYTTFFRGEEEVVICCSDGFLYFSTPDDKHVLTLPCGAECEVISHAKNWSSIIEYKE